MMTGTDMKKLLILRCPTLSDGCKLTLVVWEYYLEMHHCFPSLQETANLRGCRRSTIQAHLKEALDAQLMTKNNFGQLSVYTFLWDKFAQEMGFQKFSSIAFDKLVEAPTPKDTDSYEMASRVMPVTSIKTSRELLRYYKAFYREKVGKEYIADKPDTNRLRNLIKKFGALNAVKMVDFFLTHRGRLCLGESTVEVLYKNRESVYEKATSA